MKKSQLRNIIRESIKQLMTEQPTGITPLIGDGSSWDHYKANICPAKYAMHHTGLPITDAQNFVWLNNQYDTAGLPPLPPQPNPGIPNTQMFSCFQVHPAAEPWFTPPWNTGLQPGTHANLPQIQGLYANMQQGVADGWLYPGSISQCNDDCSTLATTYCAPPPNGCPNIGPQSQVWDYNLCECVFEPERVNPNPGTGVVSFTGPCNKPSGGCPPGWNWHGLPDCKCKPPGIDPNHGNLDHLDRYCPPEPCPFNEVWDPGLCKCVAEMVIGNPDPGNLDNLTYLEKELKCTCCDDNNPGTGISPTPLIGANTPGGCSSWNGPYAGTNLSNCVKSALWNSSDCPNQSPPPRGGGRGREFKRRMQELANIIKEQ